MNTLEFGNFITELRKEKCLTQKELAEKLNVTDKAVSRWETGKNYPDIETFQQLANIFNISISELLECKRVNNEELITISDEHIVKEIKKNKRNKKKYLSVIAVVLVLLSISCYIILSETGFFSGVIYHKIPCYSNDTLTILNTVEGFIEQQPKADGEFIINSGDFFIEPNKVSNDIFYLTGTCENGRAFYINTLFDENNRENSYCFFGEFRKNQELCQGISLNDLKYVVSQLDLTELKGYEKYNIEVDGIQEYNNTNLCPNDFQESKKKFIYKDNVLQKYNEKTLTGKYINLRIYGYDDNHGTLIAYIFCESK